MSVYQAWVAIRDWVVCCPAVRSLLRLVIISRVEIIHFGAESPIGSGSWNIVEIMRSRYLVADQRAQRKRGGYAQRQPFVSGICRQTAGPGCVAGTQIVDIVLVVSPVAGLRNLHIRTQLEVVDTRQRIDARLFS